MTILWEPDRDRAVAELASLDGAGEARAVDNVNDVAAWLDHSEDERVVVIGADVPFVEVTAFAGHLHATYPDAVIVLVRHRGRARRRGRGARRRNRRGRRLRRPRRAPAGARPRHRNCGNCRSRSRNRTRPRRRATSPRSEDGDITVVFSAKGGSGKTVVSTNLALALARNGSRVCLVDLDLEFGDVAVCLQLAPARNIADGRAST